MVTKISGSNFGKINTNTFYQYLKNNLSDETFYISVGYIPDTEYVDYAGTLDSESIFRGGLIDSEYDYNDSIFYSQHTMSYHKVFPGSVIPVVPRVNWTKGVIYNSWPNNDSYVLVRDVENGFTKLNVYLCLFAPGTESLNPPTGTSAESFIIDNYVWKYLYTISESYAIRFLDNTWMPVIPPVLNSEIENLKPGSDRFLQMTVQKTAVTGKLFEISTSDQTALETEMLVAGFPHGSTISVTARDDSGNTPNILMKSTFTYDDTYSKYIFTLVQGGDGYVGPITFLLDSTGDEVTNLTGTVAPLSGFGSNPINELSTTNIKITVRETNENYESAFVNDTPFNVISLVSNLIDVSSKKVAKKDFYFGCRSFETLYPNIYAVGDVITKGITGTSIDAEMVYNVIGVYKNKVYYVSSIARKEYKKFAQGDTVTLLGLSQKDNTISKVYDREVNFNSGNILASKYVHDTLHRTKDQIESFNFIIDFS